jgi:spoIIIJ-associated protein
MDYSEKWGRDTDEAVRLALDDLGLTIDQVEVTVLEEPSRGFFGIGSKLAKVRVEKKKPPKRKKRTNRPDPTSLSPLRKREQEMLQIVRNRQQRE